MFPYKRIKTKVFYTINCLHDKLISFGNLLIEKSYYLRIIRKERNREKKNFGGKDHESLFFGGRTRPIALFGSDLRKFPIRERERDFSFGKAVLFRLREGFQMCLKHFSRLGQT